MAGLRGVYGAMLEIRSTAEPIRRRAG